MTECDDVAKILGQYADALQDSSELPEELTRAHDHLDDCDTCTAALGAILARRAGHSAEDEVAKLHETHRRVTAEFPRRPIPRDYQHIALLASSSLRRGPMSSLARLVRELTPFLTTYKPHLYMIAGSYRMLLRCGLLRGYPPERLHCVAAGRLGGLIDLGAGVNKRPVAGLEGVFGDDMHEIATMLDADWRVDCVVYLVDPNVASSIMPETMALKRECAVIQCPFLDTYSSAVEFFGLLTSQRGHDPRPNALPSDLRSRLGYDAFPHKVLALVAHDSNKAALLRFVGRNLAFLRRFNMLVGTATTAALVNGAKPDRKVEREIGEASEDLAGALRDAGIETPWVSPLASGRDGGNLQVAESIAMGVCDSVLLLEEPRPVREHGATHHLVERAARAASHPDRLAAGGRQMLIHDVQTAQAWSDMWADAAPGGPVTLETTYRERYGVELVLAATAEDQWDSIAEEAAWYLISAIATKRASAEGSRRKRVTVAFGGAMRDVVAKVDVVSTALIARLARHINRHEDAVQRCKDAFPQHADRIEQIAQRHRLTLTLSPDNAKLWSIGPVSVAPIIGRFGSVDESVEASMVARKLARSMTASSPPGGSSTFSSPLTAKSLELDATAFTLGPASVPNKVTRHWARTDIAVLGCGGLDTHWFADANSVQLEQGLYDELLASGAVGHVAGIYLDVDGNEIGISKYRRNGMGREQIRRVAAGGGASAAIMVAGARDRSRGTTPRARAALAGLRAGMASVLVTDHDFAAAVLREDFAPAVTARRAVHAFGTSH